MLPTVKGCWRLTATPLGWSQNQLLAPSAVRWWVRLAAAGPAQQSRRSSLHLGSDRTQGTWARPAHSPGWLGQGSAGLQRRGARMVGSGDGRYLISSLQGCPSPLPGSPRSVTRLCSATPPVLRALVSSPASHPCCPGGRSRVNIGRREPFAARGQGRSRGDYPFRSWTPGRFLAS